jgi:pimeloyl-ACP methyl ester carboxylesterase
MRKEPSGPLWRHPALAALILALVAGGASGAASAPLPPLHVDCRGAPSASPTVILEAGAFGTSADWDFVLDDLAKGGRVCAYDRAGLGDSPPARDGKGVIAKAGELDRLLGQLGETRPVILVGHSNGALYVEAFASLWPRRVAGLVYVNGVGPDDLDDPRLLADLRAERRAADLAVTAGRLGLSPLVVDELEMGLNGAAAHRKARALSCLACLEAARDEDRLIIPGLDAARGLGDEARHIPTVVISGAPYMDKPLAKAWRTAEVAPALRADTAWILDMPGATHVSPLVRDRAYVVAAVDWLRSLSARAAHQTPVLGIDAQGSAGGRAPSFWSSSTETPSGERTKAMWPSRGGRLMVTPLSIRRWQVW